MIPFNTELPGRVQAQVAKRRERVLAAAESMEALGLPIRRRGNSPSTFVIPEVKRKPKINVPLPRPTEPFAPEPTLAPETYDEILKIISDMAQVMEQSPHAFAELDEEALRFHFLVPLNGHFEGGASGETFNYEGKTDILIRSKGRVVFVAGVQVLEGRQGARGDD